MNNSKEFDEAWNDIYARGEQLNRYPYDSIVTFLMRTYGRCKTEARVKVLEIGCGAGNNLWFAAREGFDITGLDASEDAIKYARKRFQQDSLNGVFEVGSFMDLPFEDNCFDVVLDRAASTNVNLTNAKRTIGEVGRVLKSSGVLYSEVFSDQSSSRGVTLADGVLSEIEGPYSGAGNIYFYSKREIESLYSVGWTLKGLSYTERKQYSVGGPVEIFSHWSITAQKE